MVKTMHPQDGNKSMQRVCVANLGLFRSGTTTLADAATTLDLKAYRKFPSLSKEQFRLFLQNPEKAVRDWSAMENGLKEIANIAMDFDIICDGWIALLPFLPPTELERFKQESADSGICLEFVASVRDIEATVQSELQHWTVHDLERQAGLSLEGRKRLEDDLRERATQHRRRVGHLSKLGLVKLLPLVNSVHEIWPKPLSQVTGISGKKWSSALQRIGVRNANPTLPVEGILVTLRLGHNKDDAQKTIASLESLLDQIEQDSLCRYLVVLGIDEDEENSKFKTELEQKLECRAELQQQMQSLHVITNAPRRRGEPFAVCSVWNKMAIVAWTEGADWVVLLGDDIEIECPYHYRTFYRSFLDISKSLEVPFGFGCPWWNDSAFPGFPSFPCVGKAHYQIFGSLIPKHRQHIFVNQDLDPYLHHLYLKFDAAPCVSDASLTNGIGGHVAASKARYNRVPAEGWRDFVLQDVAQIRQHLPKATPENILLDVIVPSYRVRLDYLESICSLKVPHRTCVNFIIIVDNPQALFCAVKSMQGAQTQNEERSLAECERVLERHLSRSGNNIRVRCNKTNVGASASRNRGLDESAAEFVLHLDDDLVPNSDLLEQYAHKLWEIDETIVGLVGLVRFPRSSTLPLRHAAVLMSYLTFMFEVADRDMYANPAWGVTANILFRRTNVRFDLAYAKTGGGEDVDYSLRVTEACNGGKLLAVPEACVTHPFWPGSVLTLAKHFYSWAIGDSALFKRFPQHCYWSFPNVPESIILVLPLSPWIGPWRFFMLVLRFLVADLIVDISNPSEYKHRCLLLQQGSGNDERIEERSQVFYLVAHILANLFVVVLECGRIRGHIGRMDVSHGMFRRFDWHIGRLANASQNFRRREGCKTCLFLSILGYELSKLPISKWSIRD